MRASPDFDVIEEKQESKYTGRHWKSEAKQEWDFEAWKAELLKARRLQKKGLEELKRCFGIS